MQLVIEAAALAKTDQDTLHLMPKELSDFKADTQFCVEAASLAETDREEVLLLSNELSEY